MRRQRRRRVHYTGTEVSDGTVLAAYPSRKPSKRTMKERGWKIDDDGVCIKASDSWIGEFHVTDPGRLRFFDIIANRLNMRRSIREIALPKIEALQKEIHELKDEVRQLTSFLLKQEKSD
jgi:hypothetical protein